VNFGRAFVDSAPVLDKAWAAKGVLGMDRAKIHNLLTQKWGRFISLQNSSFDLDLDYDYL
jgi:epoxyqueuosine reductase